MQPFANSGASAPNTTHNRLREEHSQIYVEPTYKHRTKVHLTSQKGLFIYSAKECGICVSANRSDWAIISSWRKQYIKWSWGTDAVSTKKKKNFQATQAILSEARHDAKRALHNMHTSESRVRRSVITTGMINSNHKRQGWTLTTNYYARNAKTCWIPVYTSCNATTVPNFNASFQSWQRAQLPQQQQPNAHNLYPARKARKQNPSRKFKRVRVSILLETFGTYRHVTHHRQVFDNTHSLGTTYVRRNVHSWDGNYNGRTKLAGFQAETPTTA